MNEIPRPLGWSEVTLALELLAVDRVGLRGLVVRGPAGPEREQLLSWIDELPSLGPTVRMPVHAPDDRLLGGLNLAATLRRGRPVIEEGLLRRADGGLVIVPMAERLEALPTSYLCGALDRQEVAVEREGITARLASRIGVIALDEGIDDEAVPRPIRERLALWLDLRALQLRSLEGSPPDPVRIALGAACLRSVEISDACIEALCQGAMAAGIDSLRAPLLAVRAARAHAALEGRAEVGAEDLQAAARLVLASRARALPAPEDSTPDEHREPAAREAPDPTSAASDSSSDRGAEAAGDPEEIVVAAIQSALPSGLLDTLRAGVTPSRASSQGGRSGAAQASASGRPARTLAAPPRPGQRLNVVATLRAAAPWQRLRTHAPPSGSPATRARIAVRREDFRTTQFRQRSETTVVFAVDASGSAALQRLAEAKGAVEQVLADCYVRRDQVALVAFRDHAASLLLPPTRSLTRARRCLSGLAGGGATPLAAGIDSARALGLDARKRGRTPLVVLMTDGKANIARDGSEGSARATADALESARALREAGIGTLFLDTSPRPRPRARELAEAMGARYVPLPYLDRSGLVGAVRSLSAGSLP